MSGPLATNTIESGQKLPVFQIRRCEMVDSIPVAGGSLEAEAFGSGEPVLLIHGSIVADAFFPIIDASP
jgi:hypothetical protein